MLEKCRLGVIVDFLSHAAIVGFMGGAATVVCLQQLKGIMGLVHFTHETDVVSVTRSLFSQIHQVYFLPRRRRRRHFCVTSKLSLSSASFHFCVPFWQWRWQSVVLGCSFLFFLLLTRYLVSFSILFFKLCLLRLNSKPNFQNWKWKIINYVLISYSIIHY